ncbi:unnamed protein product [Protopolystoma xenopodis]|uniref:Uncharacterized protein n=1 Tax=Protopolystoma xenopodis TaxID=117903 RepID=A0A3S5CLJ7_9PLAT|nr:unnamed protein product [Protopolystoma xenopodis]
MEIIEDERFSVLSDLSLHVVNIIHNGLVLCKRDPISPNKSQIEPGDASTGLSGPPNSSTREKLVETEVMESNDIAEDTETAAAQAELHVRSAVGIVEARFDELVGQLHTLLARFDTAIQKLTASCSKTISSGLVLTDGSTDIESTEQVFQRPRMSWSADIHTERSRTSVAVEEKANKSGYSIVHQRALSDDDVSSFDLFRKR